MSPEEGQNLVDQTMLRPSFPFQESDHAVAEADSGGNSTYRLKSQAVPDAPKRSVKRDRIHEPEFVTVWDTSGNEIRITREMAKLIGASLFFNERLFPIEELGLQFRMGMDPGNLKNMDVQSLQRSMLQVTHPEGTLFLASMKWFKIIFAITSFLALLFSLVISFAWMPAHNVLSGSLLVKPGLIPIWLVVAFNLGLLGRKLALCGWPRLLRLLSLRVSRNQLVKDWLEHDRSATDSVSGTKRRWLRGCVLGIVTFIRWIFQLLMLRYLLISLMMLLAFWLLILK